MNTDFNQIYKISRPYTMTSLAKMKKLYEAVIYINQNNIEGAYVECGVYKGGSIMNMALTQLQFTKRVYIYLYDTFEGMTPHGEFDVNHQGVSASRILKNPSKRCICSLGQVKKNISLTGYPKEFLHYYKGDVAVTLKQEIPEKIALLRLDTDWYESTKIGLEVLYPRLVQGGVLILDDYGYWKGSRKATDEYFSSIGIKPEFEPMESGVSAVMLIKKTNLRSKFLIRNDDVAFDTQLSEIKQFCEIADKHGYRILQAIIPIGESRKITSSRMTNKQIRATSGRLFGENQEVLTYLKSRNDFIGIHGLWHTHKPGIEEIEAAKSLLQGLGFNPTYFVPPFNEGDYPDEIAGLKVCNLSIKKGERLEDFLDQGTPEAEIVYLHSWRFDNDWYTFGKLEQCLQRLENSHE